MILHNQLSADPGTVGTDRWEFGQPRPLTTKPSAPSLPSNSFPLPSSFPLTCGGGHFYSFALSVLQFTLVMSGIFSGDVGSTVNPGPIIIFDAVAVVASVSLALTLAPAVFAPNIHRSKTWYSMIVTMMIFPLLYLLNAGSQFHGEHPPPIGLCILQAGFIYAGPPACTVAVLCFLADMTLGLRAVLFNGKRSQFVASALIIIPSIVFACVFFEAIALVDGNRGVHFDPAHMFCESNAKGPQVKISAILTMITLVLTLCMEVWTIVMLYRNWSAVRSIRRTKTDLQLSAMIRFGAFTLVVGFAAVMGAVTLPNNLIGGATWNIFLVTVPLLAALSFGTRRDIMSAYAFWNWRRNGLQAGRSEGKVQSSAV
ncbi:hypothetical protein DFH09DRAFT_3373 [Mycena vulgaris]|nr:hypothetical protein DFH09DRAFT_3373 [Mycena vulgaris]